MAQLPIFILSNSYCDSFQNSLFNRRKTCPPGWQPYTTSIGRILVGGPESAGLETHGTALNSGEDRQHSHSFSGSFSTSNWKYYPKSWWYQWQTRSALHCLRHAAMMTWLHTVFLWLTHCDFICRNLLFQRTNFNCLFWTSLHSITHLQELWDWDWIWFTSQCTPIQWQWMSHWLRCDLGEWQFSIKHFSCCTSSKWASQC